MNLRLLKRKLIGKILGSDESSKMKRAAKKVEVIFEKNIEKTSVTSYKKLADDEKNIFIFWHSGFDSAPPIVKCCHKRLQELYGSEFKIVAIDQYNLKEWTCLPEHIIQDYYDGKLSVQKFSDFLRFDLMYSHGGIWVDSTIYFAGKMDLLSFLNVRSVNSLHTSTSEKFFSYKGKMCKWSSYFFAGRKNSVLCKNFLTLMIAAVDSISDQPYFLTDVVLAVLSAHDNDDGVLDNIFAIEGDPLYMIQHMNDLCSENARFELEKIPQKLNWRIKKEEIREDIDSIGAKYLMLAFGDV